MVLPFGGVALPPPALVVLFFLLPFLVVVPPFWLVLLFFGTSPSPPLLTNSPKGGGGRARPTEKGDQAAPPKGRRGKATHPKGGRGATTPTELNKRMVDHHMPGSGKSAMVAMRSPCVFGTSSRRRGILDYRCSDSHVSVEVDLTSRTLRLPAQVSPGELVEWVASLSMHK